MIGANRAAAYWWTSVTAAACARDRRRERTVTECAIRYRALRLNSLSAPSLSPKRTMNASPIHHAGRRG